MALPSFLTNKKAAIFDMDGTIVHNMPFHEKAWDVFAKKHGKTLSPEDYRWMLGRKNQEIMPHFFGELTQEEIDQLTLEKETLYQELFAKEIAEVPGLIDFLRLLKENGFKIGIGSSAPKLNRIFIFKHLPIYDYFDTVVGAEDVTYGKPHPEIFLQAATKLGVDPKSCVVFEDAPNGIEAAKKAGMYVVGLATTHQKNALHTADTVINNFRELITTS